MEIRDLRFKISDLWAGDHFDGSGVFGTAFNNEGRGFDEAVELGAFFENDGTGAGNLTTDMAVDGGGDRGDGVEEFDTCAFFNAEIMALNGADDFAVTADDEIPGAFDRTGEFAKHGEVVATQRGSRDYAGFLDCYVATSLDQTVPVTCNFIIQQTNITTAFRTLTGLCLGDRRERMATVEATDITGWFERIDQAL